MRIEPYTVVQWTQHWCIIDGAFYREAIVRLADGTHRLYAILEDEA